MFHALEKHLDIINKDEKVVHMELDTFVGNHTLVDPEIFTLWINGNSAEEAANTIQSRHGGSNARDGVEIDFLIADVYDHYRTYSMLEKYLQNPPRLPEQWIFQIEPRVQKWIIHKYYDFDDDVMREFLGKKLTSRLRKDLDEVSEKTGINLRSCRRQFDNTKRIYKTVEELNGSLVHNIKHHFLLTEELSKKYSAVVFITSNRFETSKKKLHYLSFKNFYDCANAMMLNWTNPIIDDDDNTADVEREFLMELRELRCLLDKDKEHKALVCQKLKGQVQDRILQELENNFKVYSRTLINIAYGLNHSKELKDLFVDLVEKYIEPCRHLQWTNYDLKAFLDAYSDTAAQLEPFKSQPTMKTVMRRYMDGISGCLLAMYQSH